MDNTLQLTMENPQHEKIGPGVNLQVLSVSGNKITVVIKDKSEHSKRKMKDVLAGYCGGLYRNAQEIDEFLRTERESWDR